MINKMVSVDFWNTLVDADKNGEKRTDARMQALRSVARQHGMDLGDDAIRQAREEVSRIFDEEWYGRQRTQTTDELVRGMVRVLGIPAAPAQIDELTEAFRQSLFLGPPPLAGGVKESLEAISTYYSLAIISDTMFSPGSVIRTYLDQMGVLKYFQAFAFSDELGVSKPHKKSFETVLKATGAQLSGSWHVGDMLQTDIAGAKSIGLRSILYTGFSTPDSRESSADYNCATWENVADILISELG